MNEIVMEIQIQNPIMKYSLCENHHMVLVFINLQEDECSRAFL